MNLGFTRAAYATGWNETKQSAVEVFDVSLEAELDCPPLPKFPRPISEAMGGFVKSKNPNRGIFLVCGGTTPTNITSDCYYYDKIESPNEWLLLEEGLSIPRAQGFAASFIGGILFAGTNLRSIVLYCLPLLFVIYNRWSRRASVQQHCPF